MWNRFASTIQDLIHDPSVQRLGLAIFFSVILHAFLVGGLNLSLPSLKKEMHVIKATILMPKVLAKAKPDLSKQLAKNLADEVATASPPVQELVKPVEQAPVIETSAQAMTDLEIANPEINNAAASENAIQQASATEASQTQAESVDLAQPEPQPLDAGLVINENAYQYVETEFDVRTKIDGETEGKAKITFNLKGGAQYQLNSLIEPKGLAALIISNLVQTSEGQLTKNGLQPLTYLYQYGDKADKTYKATFDWPAKKVNLMTAKSTKTEAIADGTQDLLSFMYQFMYVPPLQHMQISIATGKKLATYDYSFEGEENIITALGEVKTIHIFHEGVETEEKTELWLALDYQYVPVKIRKTEKNGKVYELVATRINTARPTQN